MCPVITWVSYKSLLKINNLMAKYKGDFIKDEDIEKHLAKYNKKAIRLCLCIKYNPESHSFMSDGVHNRICPKCKVKIHAECCGSWEHRDFFVRQTHKVRLPEKQ